jgi:tricorn protease
MRKKYLLLLLIVFIQHLHAQQKGFYLNPSISGNIIAFRAEGDLWKYDMGSGVTTRLTANQALEAKPMISPDGKQIAFLAQYEGALELYVTGINGGVPKRLTYDFDEGFMNLSGWTKDGKILFSTSKYSLLPGTQLVKIDPLTMIREHIPLAQAADGVYDENGNLYFTRLPGQSSRTKRYKGGTIEHVWKFDGSHEAVNLTPDYDGTSRNPMYANGRIYFISDRDGTMNLWSMNTTGKDLQQLSFSKGWDIKSATISGSTIAYQKAADIYTVDIKSKQDKLMDINLISDFDQRKPRWIKSPVNSVSSTGFSPTGNYVALISRGRLFVSPAKSDRWIEISRRSGIRFRDVDFLDDKTLIVLSDESGEYELWKMNADGSGGAKQITSNSKNQIAEFAASPDGKYIGYTDKNSVLRMVETATGTEKYKYTDAYGSVEQLGWSANSKNFSFVRQLDNLTQQICVVDLNSMKLMPVTTKRLESYSPAWTPDNHWLYFISERNLKTSVHSPWGSRQPEPYYNETSLIYAMALDTGLKFPFTPTDSWLSDSLFNPDMKKKEAAAPKDEKNKPTLAAPKTALPVDWSNANQLLYPVPVKNGNLRSLDISHDGYLYWINSGEDEDPNDGKLFSLKIGESKKYEATEIASGVTEFHLSRDKKKILIFLVNNITLVADANGQKTDVEKSKLQLQNWAFQINPPQDWKQIYEDAWRMERDYFYDRDMHQVDWPAVKAKYETLIDRVTDRDELNVLIADMVGELSALHTFVFGGDTRRSAENIPAGFLGASFQKKPEGLMIEHIYQSDPDYPEMSSPLNKPYLQLKEGDIITGVNNVSLKEVQDMSELLANKVNIPVKLSLMDRKSKSFEEVVIPCSARMANDLKYNEWELTRRERVDSLSREDIGYIHLKAMTTTDMDDFVKQFYPVFNRRGLILDVRHNGGGNIDSWVLEKLMRKAWMYWQSRSGGPTWNMQFAFRGHMVILCDQQSGSDGEAVVEGFRRLGMGKVIGMRTWGGEIWLSMDNREVDNGIASAAENGVYGPEGKWLIEGHGVDPDFVVDNLPFETYKGKDAQLEFAVDYLKKEIIAHPVEVPPAPVHPDKSFKY